MKLEKLTRDFIKTLTEPQKKRTTAYDSKGIVTRIEDGIAWVKLAGSKIETPLQMTISADPGDEVQARIGNGTGWLTGNGTKPPTDDSMANKSYKAAKTADAKAAAAGEIADLAADAAANAQISANSAAQAASTAQGSANAAQASANSASEYASRALGNLATVQSVAETLTWITQHGTMTLTSDVAIDPSHVYFVVDAAGDYVVGGTHYSIATEPHTEDLGTYYELNIDESLNNYVGTHLALTEEGLWLLPAVSGVDRILIATGAGTTYTEAGTYIIDPQGTTLASFRANGITIGDILTTYLAISQHSIKYYDDGVALFELSGEDGSVISSGHYSCILESYVSSNERTLTMLGDEWKDKSMVVQPQYDTQYFSKIFVDGVDVTNSQSEYNAYTGFAFYKEGYPETQILLAWTQTVSVQLYLIDTNFDISFDAESGTITIKHLGVSGTFHLLGEYPLHIRNLKANIGGNDVNGTLGFAAGFGCTANGYAAMAFGHENIAEGEGSLVAGQSNEAWESTSFVVGFNNKAYNANTIAAGNGIVAKGWGSTVFGYETKSTRSRETVIGKYNATEAGSEFADGTYAFIIGNGSSGSRSNALTVDWAGNEAIAGTLTQNSDRRLKEHVKFLNDEDQEVDEFIRSLKPAHYIKDGELHVGFYAQDVAEIDPYNCMTGEMNGYMTLGYTELIAPLVAYCQSLERRIEELEKGV